MHFKYKVYNYARNNRLLRVFYKNIIKEFVNPYGYSAIGEITPFKPRTSGYKEKRLNLIIPSINQEHLFGGIATALDIFQRISAEGNFKNRIIVTDAAIKIEDLSDNLREYSLLKPFDDNNEDFLIVDYSDRFNKTVPIGINDYFLATAWWTAYFAQRLVQWQSEIYYKPIKKIIYLIQDYEPGFYPWSSQYVLAESTYKSHYPQIAVFNTKVLKEYFNKIGIYFEHEYFFEQVLNKNLRAYLEKNMNGKKKKKILIYGRPSVPRNGFALIVEALRLWVWQQPDVHEWKLISAGEPHVNIEIGNGVTLISKGKMTLDEYAKVLSESSVGISLMFSPHPSYPPMEMAVFGLQVITNSFANKKLDNIATNIVSLENLSPESLADELLNACNKSISALNEPWGNNNQIYSTDEKNRFSFMSNLLSDL